VDDLGSFRATDKERTNEAADNSLDIVINRKAAPQSARARSGVQPHFLTQCTSQSLVDPTHSANQTLNGGDIGNLSCSLDTFSRLQDARAIKKLLEGAPRCHIKYSLSMIATTRAR
jgi:hypothetical protein